MKGSSNYWEGRLEVLHDFSWGSVCGKRFTLTHGDIACKSLGLGKAQKVFQTASSGYGRGVGRIWLGDFECRDPQSADSLLECKHSRWRYSSCRTDHGWDVGVRCSVPRPDTKVLYDRLYFQYNSNNNRSRAASRRVNLNLFPSMPAEIEILP